MKYMLLISISFVIYTHSLELSMVNHIYAEIKTIIILSEVKPKNLTYVTPEIWQSKIQTGTIVVFHLIKFIKIILTIV